MKFIKLISLGVALILTTNQETHGMTKKVVSVQSPNGEISLDISVEDGALNYWLFWKGQLMIDRSRLSIFPNQSLEIMDTSTQIIDQMWKPTWGQFSTVRDYFKETTIHFNVSRVSVKLICRVYDSGIAFRFITDANQTITMANYHCDFNLPEGSKIYYPRGEREPIGPIRVGEIKQRIRLPVVVEHISGKYLSLMESDLYGAEGFSVMQFQAEEGLLYSSNSVESSNGKIITPWRVVLLEENIGDLVTNMTPLNLATPNQIEDPSWIKPGKTLWDWRVLGYRASDGFKYGVNTESYMRFIDFASENAIEYFLIDALWYKGISQGVFEHSENLDLEK